MTHRTDQENKAIDREFKALSLRRGITTPDMFILYAVKDTPMWFGLRTRRTFPIVGSFDTWNDAVSYAYHVHGFTHCNQFFVSKEETVSVVATLCKIRGFNS